MPERDRYTDSFKGMLILWVIHIHTVFWTGDSYVPEAVRQASLLIDVPVFFFISGYLIRPADPARLFRKPARQFVRLYGRYLVISVLLLLFSMAGTRLMTGSWSPLPASALTSMLRLNPGGEPWDFIRIYGPSLWFVRVYLSLLVLVPLVIGLSGFRRLRLLLLILLLVLFSLCRYQGWDHAFLFTGAVYVFFYLVFYQLGAIYGAEEHTIGGRHLALSILFNLLLCGLAFHFDGNRIVLQENKFPPSFQYLFYSLLLVHVFVVARRSGKFPGGVPFRHAARFFAWCGKNVYFIYLFQCAVCSLPYLFIPALRGRLSPFAIYCVVLTFNISVTLVVTRLYVMLEAVAVGNKRGP